MTPTPEPGQRVWIAAEVVASVAGHPMLTPITADGEPSAIRLAAARYRWHPADVPPQPESPANPRRLYWALRGLVEAVEKNAASLDHDAVRSALEAISAEDERYAQWSPDVPPQPPVLAEGMPVRIADDPSPWEIHTIAVKEELGWWSATVRLKPDLSGIRARRSAPLADVPGPDDTTPEIAEDSADSDRVQPAHSGFDTSRPGQFRTLIEGDWVTTNYHMASHHHGERRPVERLDIAWSPWWPGKPDPVPSLDDPQANPWATPEPPPVGEGAALIAATEQEIAERFSEEPRPLSRAAYAAKSAAWEATARRACAKLDELVRSVGVIRPWLVRHGFPAGDTRHLPQQAVDALEEQRGELEAARGAPVQVTTHGEAGEAQEGAQAAPRVANSSTGANGSLPAVQGAGRDWRGELVAVLLKHGPGDVLTCRCGWGPSQRSVIDLANHRADAIVAFLGLHDLEQAAAERDAARHNRDQIADTLSRTWDAAQIQPGAGTADLPEVVRRIRQQREDYREAHVRAWAERDAARRELEQLRGEVARVADWFERMADTIGEGPYTDRYLRYAKRVRAALAAAAAPATQDGDPK